MSQIEKHQYHHSYLKSVFCDISRQIEELKATLECERIYREKLESRLDESKREIATLTIQLNESHSTPSDNYLINKSKVHHHLDHQNTKKMRKVNGNTSSVESSSVCCINKHKNR
ncbi:unnamed protein product [Schistosoma turkestanicum]|nr:unnamed protein product [Schistosoma turkestanicum]